MPAVIVLIYSITSFASEKCLVSDFPQHSAPLHWQQTCNRGTDYYMGSLTSEHGGSLFCIPYLKSVGGAMESHNK